MGDRPWNGESWTLVLCSEMLYWHSYMKAKVLESISSVKNNFLGCCLIPAQMSGAQREQACSDNLLTLKELQGNSSAWFLCHNNLQALPRRWWRTMLPAGRSLRKVIPECHCRLSPAHFHPDCYWWSLESPESVLGISWRQKPKARGQTYPVLTLKQ